MITQFRTFIQYINRVTNNRMVTLVIHWYWRKLPVEGFITKRWHRSIVCELWQEKKIVLLLVMVERTNYINRLFMILTVSCSLIICTIISKLIMKIIRSFSVMLEKSIFDWCCIEQVYLLGLSEHYATIHCWIRLQVCDTIPGLCR